MKYRIDTSTPTGTLVESKVSDFSKPGNLKWFTSHLKWCVTNDRLVQITPLLESN